MAQLKRYIPGVILLDTALFAVIMALLRRILSSFHLMLRAWVGAGSGILILLGLIAGIVQLILRIRKKPVKLALLGVFAALLVLGLASPVGRFGLALALDTPEHVVERDGAKYVARPVGFIETDVYYYDYKGFLVCGSQARIEEWYGNGAFDPIKDADTFASRLRRTRYYDENGQLLSEVNVDGD